VRGGRRLGLGAVTGFDGVDQPDVLDPGVRRTLCRPDAEDPVNLEVQRTGDRGQPPVATDLDGRRCNSLFSSATREKSSRSVASRAASNNARNRATSASVARSAASRAAMVSSRSRTMNMSARVEASGEDTTAPRRGTMVTKPSACTTRSASRTGFRETPKSLASRSSVSRSPGG